MIFDVDLNIIKLLMNVGDKGSQIPNGECRNLDKIISLELQLLWLPDKPIKGVGNV